MCWNSPNTTQATVGITGITQANPGVVTVYYPSGYGPFNNGDQVFITGTGTALDSTPGRQYLIINATATTFSLTDLDGNAIDTTNYAAYSGVGGTVARVYTLTTPYAGSDVQLLKWTQSNDVLTLCHPNYPPQDLTRTEHWAWTLAQISFAASISPPTSLTISHIAGTDSPTGQTFYYSYVVTAVSLSPPEQSLAFNSRECSVLPPRLRHRQRKCDLLGSGRPLPTSTTSTRQTRRLRRFLRVHVRIYRADDRNELYRYRNCARFFAGPAQLTPTRSTGGRLQRSPSQTAVPAMLPT